MIWQIRLVVLIPHAIVKWSETRKRWPRKESSVPTLCPSLAAPLAGTLSVFWPWQVGINPRQDSLFGDCLQSLQGNMKPQSRAHHLHRAGHVIHLHKHTIELVKYSRKCAYWESREARALSVLTLSWRYQTSSQDDSLRWIVLDLWSPKKKIKFQDQGPLDHSRAFV